MNYARIRRIAKTAQNCMTHHHYNWAHSLLNQIKDFAPEIVVKMDMLITEHEMWHLRTSPKEEARGGE